MMIAVTALETDADLLRRTLDGDRNAFGELFERHAPAVLRCRAHGQLAQAPELLGEADERVHDLHERGVARPLLDRPRGADDRPHLHLVDLGIEQPEPAAARSQHRVRLAPRLGGGEQLPPLVVELALGVAHE